MSACGGRHEADRDDERGAAAVPVPVGADHDGADRAHDEADRESRERGQQPGDRVCGREEGLGERRRHEGVDEEVVDLEDLADAAGHDRASDGCRIRDVMIGGRSSNWEPW